MSEVMHPIGSIVGQNAVPATGRAGIRLSLRRRSARAAVLLCVLSLAVASAPFATAGTGGVSIPDGADVESALVFRQKLGLRSDRAYVAATFTQRGFSKAAWGVPLDQAEAADVQRR